MGAAATKRKCLRSRSVGPFEEIVVAAPKKSGRVDDPLASDVELRDMDMAVLYAF